MDRSTPHRFADEGEAVTYIFRSLRRLRGALHGLDEHTRDITPTRMLLAEADLLGTPREYAVVTGSKGKGSTTFMTARILQALGHTVGMMTSPHLVSYRERIRVNGRAIPEADFTRILGGLAPHIDRIEAGLAAHRYFSPQGLFLAVALRWFDEQGVNAAVLEVGRGGRFDDIAVVPNRLSLFTPIMLEHPHQLGPTVERIAWHKAGIIKPMSYAYSAPQQTAVLDVLTAEADAQHAEFYWLTQADLGEHVADTPRGQQIRLGRYGQFELSLFGRYQIGNAALAVQGAGSMHARLPGIGHGTPAYAEAVRGALGGLHWPGRVTRLEEAPHVWVDGAINAASAASLARSLEGRITEPTAAIVAVPDDKDYEGVYREIGLLAEHLIVTETARNITLHFPAPDTALAAARRYNDRAIFRPTLAEALEHARGLVGREGTILIVGTQSLVADAIGLYGMSYEVL
jgi:dihydrofolate synthase/folylpolyglutamate synthase